MGTWTAPSAIERQLDDARAAGNWPAFLDALALTELFVPQSRAYQDAHPTRLRLEPAYFPQVRARAYAVFTAGMLPVPTPELVFERQDLAWFADHVPADGAAYLAVNPGTPFEVFLPASPAHRATWDAHYRNKPRYAGLETDKVHALHIGGPLHGPVAFGLACGAHLSVRNGMFWNSLAYHGDGYTREREKLDKWWGVTTREDWLSTTRQLLGAEMVSPVWEYALRVRRSLAQDFAGAVDTEHWRHAAEYSLRAGARRAAEPRLTPEGVTTAAPRPAAEVEGEIAGVRRLIGRIARYEQRFRADGLLGEGRFVRSVEAWDYGRASQMARWGLGARFGTIAETEDAVVRAGEACRLAYRSWEDLSAGFVLGRCLHFDEEEFGHWYGDMVTAHRELTSDPGSPWLNLPWSRT
ncbi:DUF1266 domain-containing protein [Streptomyces goshikiensis]|uniref:DUF1266 domain-containing protein n=1 Tax=Streptomyces TaxID=1883 RepID=UPI000F54CAC7|nr:MULTISPECIES: DUF1266 domain-containing protein [Streptomyces]RPK48631.1 hypothetical protein EES37_08770 [Streptomyces sp. ADI91-18]WBY21141.1 DUF1266 domain-containing protein [Streptomyces goshikiensis]WSR99932.1 DUF1266 domain-containing protein [Streptomyces goshikiensis]WSX99061.1 DUF1266 domain-containing protein [Streptomyces goshikiensis]